MDYPYTRKTRYNASNNFWFLPTDLFATVQEKENSAKTLYSSPILSYLDRINRRDKFTYLIIILVVVLFLYRIDLTWTIWVGLIIGIMVVYYFNERSVIEVNSDADQLWAVLKSPLLNKTKYFITDPPMIRWANDVSELKVNNILEFNKMITILDRLLKMIYDIKIGVIQCKENLDLIRDLKTTSLNQFHSLIYNLGKERMAHDMRQKYNHYFEELGHLLSQRYANLVKICKTYYATKPVDITTSFDITGMDEPSPMDVKGNPHYDFY